MARLIEKGSTKSLGASRIVRRRRTGAAGIVALPHKFMPAWPAAHASLSLAFPTFEALAS
ncbi:MAG: hypothetical protein JRN52_07250 [Nitrososphaerota archaeon]|nr:hypothetical protein [Nitrososphaerota archaeon]